MDGSGPVFSDRRDIKLWKMLCSIESGVSDNNIQRMEAKLTRIIVDTRKKEGTENPWILCKILDLIDILPVNDKRQFILDALECCSPADCRPKIRGVSLLMEYQEYETASQILDSMKYRNNIAEWEYIRAMLYMKASDIGSAYEHLVRCYKADNGYGSVCTDLENIRPGEGWIHRGRMEYCRKGNPFRQTNDSEESPLRELALLYRDWYEGDRDTLQLVRSSVRYEQGDTDYILAAARFSSEAGDHESSVSDYLRLGGMGFSVSLELVREYMNAARYDDATELCLSLSKICEGDRRLNEIWIEALSHTDRKGEMSVLIDKYLSYDYADIDAYMMSADFLIRARMFADSTTVIMKLESTIPDDPEVQLLSSRNDFAVGNLPSALISINKAIRRHPDNIGYRLHRSKVLAGMGSFPKAMVDLDTVLAKDPENMDALSYKRDVLIRQEDYEGALDICNRIRETDPTNGNNTEITASVMQRLGRHDEALRTFRDAIGIHHDQKLFGQVLMQLVENGKYEDAISIISEYDDLYGDTKEPWILKGNAEYGLERFADACDSYDRALELDPSDPIVWHSKGMAAEMLGDLDRARASYDRAILLDLDNSDYWISKSIIDEKAGDLKGSMSALDHIISTHPDNPYALVRKAEILTKTGRYREATTMLSMASMADPGNADIKCALRDIHMRLGNTEMAIMFAKDAVRMRKDDEVRIALADIYVSEGRMEDAIRALSGSNSIQCMKFVRKAYHDNGDDKAEFQACKRILKVYPEDVETLIATAELYAAMGRQEEAAKMYERAKAAVPEGQEELEEKISESEANSAEEEVSVVISRDPEDAESLMELADRMMQANRYQEAESYMEKAIAVDPQSSLPYLKKAEMKIQLGLFRDALDIMSAAKEASIIRDPMFWKISGDAYRSLGSFPDALNEYMTAAQMDEDIPGIFRCIGEIQFEMDVPDQAKQSFFKAYEKDPRDTAVLNRLAFMYFDEGNLQESCRFATELLGIDPFNGPVLVLKCNILMITGDYGAVEATINDAKASDNVDRASVAEMDFIMSTIEAKRKKTKDLALMLLKASDQLSLSLGDPKTIASAGLTEKDAEEVLNYLSDIVPYGPIDVGDGRFERMEQLSYNALSAGADIDSSPVIPLQIAALRVGTADTDEAKELVSYIYAAMTCEVEAVRTPDAERALSETDETCTTVSSIMRAARVGVYTARIVQKIRSQ